MAPVVALALLAACKGGSADDTEIVDTDPIPADTDPDTSTCTGDCWIAEYVTASGSFAWDGASGEVRSALVGAVITPPTVLISVYSANYINNVDTTEYCNIEMIYDGGGTLDLATYAFVYSGTSFKLSGFVIPEGAYELDITDGDCVNMDATPIQAITADDLAARGWGVVVGTFLPEVQNAIEASADDPSVYAGAGFYWGPVRDMGEGLDEGVSPFGYSRAFRLDAQLNVVNGDGAPASQGEIAAGDVQLIQRSEILASTLPTAWYTTGATRAWHFASQ